MKDRRDAPETAAPDREELDEVIECFECRAVVAPFSARYVAVTEGIVLCHDCSARRGGRFDPAHELWVMPPWFEDLAGKGHHV